MADHICKALKPNDGSRSMLVFGFNALKKGYGAESLRQILNVAEGFPHGNED